MKDLFKVHKIVALVYGLACHGIFLLAGIVMYFSILTGFKYSIGSLQGIYALLINFLLVIQFPFFHSFFLSGAGMRVLDKFGPREYARSLRTTIYATFASLQLLALFCFWSYSGIIMWEIPYPYNFIMIFINFCSWLLLTTSSIQAGYQVQTGSLGWTSLYKNKRPEFPDMPVKGLFSIVRQPIYISFIFVLWSTPNMSADLFTVSIFYTGYCFLGPFLKERRFHKIYGKRFLIYKSRVPYFFPAILKKRVNN